MSLWKLDPERFHEQITDDIENKRLTWKPRELKDNIFELLGIAQRLFNVRIKGKPYRINEETFAINYEGSEKR